MLECLNKLDPSLLELINYTNTIFSRKDCDCDSKVKITTIPQLVAFLKTESNSALHKALREGNNRSVDIILEYMAKIGMNASENFAGVFDLLIDYPNFKKYIADLPM